MARDRNVYVLTKISLSPSRPENGVNIDDLSERVYLKRKDAVDAMHKEYDAKKHESDTLSVCNDDSTSIIDSDGCETHWKVVMVIAQGGPTIKRKTKGKTEVKAQLVY